MSLDYLFWEQQLRNTWIGVSSEIPPRNPDTLLVRGLIKSQKVRFNTILLMCEILSFGCYIIFSIWSLATIDLHFSDFHRHRLWKSLVGSTHRNSVSHPSPRENASESSGPSIHSQSFEGVRLENLTKVFRLSKGVTRTAVNDLTIEFRLGEVTALLGHNGAGKSTTM